MKKEIIDKEEFINAAINAAKRLNNAVGITLGPMGQNVIIRKGQMLPHATKDGVTVASHIFLENQIEDIFAQLIKQAASKTAEDAGDGTTTSTILACYLIKETLKLERTGLPINEIKRGMKDALNQIVKLIGSMSKKVTNKSEKLLDIASISANNDDEIGNLIYQAIKAVGNEGAITVEESRVNKTFTTITDGLQFNQGYMSPYFLGEGETEIELNDCIILLADRKIDSMKKILHIMEAVTQNNKSLLIICSDIEQWALNQILLNHIQGLIKVVVVKSEGYGDRRKGFMEDIAVLTNNIVISQENNNTFSKTEASDLGAAEKVIITKHQTTIVGGVGSEESRLKQIQKVKKIMQDSKVDSDRHNCRTRIAKLAGGVAIIHVGAYTEAELIEKKDRIDDSLHATKAAIEEGIVSGGGSCYLSIYKQMKEAKSTETNAYKAGHDLVRKSLLVPSLRIIQNANMDNPDLVMGKVLEMKGKNAGYSPVGDKYHEDMIKAKIIDPAKVSRVCIENAVSVATLVLSSGCIINDVIEDGQNNFN